MSEHDNQRTAEMFDCVFDAAQRDSINYFTRAADDKDVAQSNVEDQFRWHA